MRIIAGAFRGRVLRAPAGDKTRPTSSRAREALFSILGNVDDSNVLDLYAGSGALGIEALSRGARHATFVESARPALQAIRENLALVEAATRATLLPLKAEAARSALTPFAPFDLILCDPPWALAGRALGLLDGFVSSGLVTSDARIVLEHSAREPLSFEACASLDVITERRWGDTAAVIFAPVSSSGEPADDT
jgi:16S rRNA (guanine(966)-N(2))-methyltransferase RsmD